MMRVLEVVTNMQVGGIERWLLDVTGKIDRRQTEIDFACRTISDQAAQQLSALGCRIHLVPHLQEARRGCAALRTLRRQHGYDAVHTHLHHMAGVVLWMARWAGFRIRIAHSHLDSRPAERHAGRRFLARNALLSALIRRHATAGLACSSDAAASLYGVNWRDDNRWRVLLYGIDLDPFSDVVGRHSRASVRSTLGIPADAVVIGNIGRFVHQKNHAFFVRVAADIARQRQDAHFLLLGDGPLRPAIERQISELGLAARFHIVTDRTDVATFTQAMDLFLFPSTFEGLGIAAVEAQASGLPCVLTDTLPSEATVIGSHVRRMALSASPAEWAAATLAPFVDQRNPAQALAAVKQSGFNVDVNSRTLQQFYAAQVNGVD